MLRGILAATIALLAPEAIRAADTVRLSVDLTGAPGHMLHATMRIPAVPGPMTLRYPKWLPGRPKSWAGLPWE